MDSSDSLYIGLRSQDFHEGLKPTANFPLKDVHYKKTILNQLIKKPVSRASLFTSLGIDNKAEAMICDVMKAGHLLDIQPVAGEEIVYSPLAVDGNPSLYLDWAKRFPNEVGEVIDLLKGNQGIPVTDQTVSSHTVINAAIHTRVIMPVQVSGATGEQQFLFAPVGNLASEERVILDKARAILSCVRYGERFAAGKHIMYPKSIIRTLRENKRFSKGHPDLFSQYSLLVEKMIGHPFQDSTGYWNFAVDDTPENMKAFDVALEMISGGEAPSARINLDAQKALLTPTSYQSPISTRTRLANTVEASSESRADILRQLANLARGAN